MPALVRCVSVFLTRTLMFTAVIRAGNSHSRALPVSFCFVPCARTDLKGA